MLRTTDGAYKRMVEEQIQLQERITKLEDTTRAVRRNERTDISLNELHDMEEQLHHMVRYNRVLCTRISKVKESTPACTE